MKLNFIKSQSSIKPELIDTTSSKKNVYIRQNITETQIEDSIFYEYEEAKLSKEEYQKYSGRIFHIFLSRTNAPAFPVIPSNATKGRDMRIFQENTLT